MHKCKASSTHSPHSHRERKVWMKSRWREERKRTIESSRSDGRQVDHSLNYRDGPSFLIHFVSLPSVSSFVSLPRSVVDHGGSDASWSLLLFEAQDEAQASAVIVTAVQRERRSDWLIWSIDRSINTKRERQIDRSPRSFTPSFLPSFLSVLHLHAGRCWTNQSSRTCTRTSMDGKQTEKEKKAKQTITKFLLQSAVRTSNHLLSSRLHQFFLTTLHGLTSARSFCVEAISLTVGFIRNRFLVHLLPWTLFIQDPPPPSQPFVCKDAVSPAFSCEIDERRAVCLF